MFGPRGGFDIQPEVVLATIIAFIIAITIHEFMHAWSALQLGDTTAYHQGRVTLNPASHLDPLGFIMMVFLALGFGFLAWGRPVPINPARLRGGKWGVALTAIAGPASNLVMATLLIIPLRFGDVQLTGFADVLLTRLITLNLLLTAFNMIPIPPLDGSKILSAILPDFWYQYLAPLERYSFGILLVLILVGGGVLWQMYSPVYFFLYDHVVGSTQL